MLAEFNAFFPWVLSALTIWAITIAGSKKPNAWLYFLGLQCLWLLWILTSETWGLLPLTLALAIVGARNHLKWSK